MAKSSITRSSDSKTTLQQPEDSRKDAKCGWIEEQVIKLASAWNEPTPEPRLAVYSEVLMEIDRECLSVMFYRALREFEKFPSIAELRKLAGKCAEDRGIWIDDAILKVTEYAAQLDNLQPGEAPPAPPSARVVYALKRMEIGASELSLRDSHQRQDFHAAYIEWAEQNEPWAVRKLQ